MKARSHIPARFSGLILDEEHRNNFFKSARLCMLRVSGLMVSEFKNMLYVSRFVPSSSPFSNPGRPTPFPDSFVCFIWRRPFTGCYNKFYEKGTYTCIVCDQELFSSDTKYDSGCGWPAFNEVLDQGRIKLTKDTSHGKQLSSWSVLVSVSLVIMLAFFS